MIEKFGLNLEKRETGQAARPDQTAFAKQGLAEVYAFEEECKGEHWPAQAAALGRVVISSSGRRASKLTLSFSPLTTKKDKTHITILHLDFNFSKYLQ